MHFFHLKCLLLDPKQGLDKPWIVWPSPKLIPLGLPQLQIRTFLNNLLMKEVSVVVHRILEVAWLLLWLWGMRDSWQFRKCCVDCLSCPDLSRSLEVKPNITGRTYSSINIKYHETHCKIRNYIYLLTCKNCSIKYVGESITPVNLRMNINRKGKSGCEHFINHCKNVCAGASFSIHVLEKLDGFINGLRDFAVQKLCLQREDYWMKKL